MAAWEHACRWSRLEVTLERVDAMARRGLTVEEIQRDLDLSDMRERVPARMDARHDNDWQITTRTLIERAWRSVRGQGAF